MSSSTGSGEARRSADPFTRAELAECLPGPYLAGRCTAFAIAVRRATGWPLAVLRTPHGDYAHCGCLAPDGRYVDARGFLDEAGFRDMFGAGPIESPVPEAAALADHPQPERVIALASLHARMLLDLPGPDPHRARFESFAAALEGLCREHGVWLRGAGGGVAEGIVAYEADGEEGPFAVGLLPVGGAVLTRTFVEPGLD